MENSPHALVLIKSLLANDPANPELYLLLSEAYLKNGDTQLADKFRKAYHILKD